MNALPTPLAAHPGEHNARRAAMRNQAEARRDYLTAHEADLIAVRGKDGSPRLGAISYPLDYPARAQVYAINERLAADYASQHGKAMWFARQATAYDAFLAYDAALAVSDERRAAA